MGNGDKTSGEGYQYLGRGYIQLTSKNNYSTFAQIVSDNILHNTDFIAINTICYRVILGYKNALAQSISRSRVRQ